jgi:hypothetical protein
MTVLINVGAAETWFGENDPEGVRSNMRFWNDTQNGVPMPCVRDPVVLRWRTCRGHAALDGRAAA